LAAVRKIEITAKDSCRVGPWSDLEGRRKQRPYKGVSSTARALAVAIGFAWTVTSLLHAAPAPHPDRPDRLVETRDGFSVEYSPGQEAWMEMAFVEMKAEAAKTVEPAASQAAARPRGTAVPGSAQYLQENRDVVLAAIARQTGLPKPTALHVRVFDTFLGYYKLTTELMHDFARRLPATLHARHLAIWQRDDLVARLRSGAKIEGMSYDPVADSGRFGFKFDLGGGGIGDRLREIQVEIEAQKLKHEFRYGEGSYSASFTLGKAPDARKTPDDKPAVSSDDIDAVISRLVMPIIYRGDLSTAPTAEAFAYLQQNLVEGRAILEKQATGYRDANMMMIILHEAAEAGLVENVITCRDRRWLCDGTANYVAWRVTRDLVGLDFAQQAYNLDAQLQRHAVHQTKVNLATWSAGERQKKSEADTELTRAHYTFATRAMFLIAERHGENALAQLWADVARTPRKKVTAKTFAGAYRKRFKADLGLLIAEAQTKPVPAVVAASLPQP
jgi:hypothetical protein